MPGPGIEPGPLPWEASALTTELHPHVEGTGVDVTCVTNVGHRSAEVDESVGGVRDAGLADGGGEGDPLALLRY